MPSPEVAIASVGGHERRPIEHDPRGDLSPTLLAGARIGLCLVAVLFLAGVLVLPLAAVASEALGAGVAAAWKAVTEADALAAFRLSIVTVVVAVSMNTVFGLAAAWAVTKFRFRGKAVLVSLIDLPFGVSPVISGMIFVLLFGARGLLGPTLSDYGLSVIFAPPGIILATVFVTFPFVARELIPLMQAQGRDEEEAAASLGASGWQILRRVTLPNIRWALAYGVILCAARALGEFGAVSVVSGHIRGRTNTAPLHVEILYNEYRFAAAFSVASVLVLSALVVIIVKSLLEPRVAEAAATPIRKGGPT